MSTLSPHFRLDNPREREKETIRETAERSDAEAAFFREHPYMGGFAFLQLTKEVAILSPSRQVIPSPLRPGPQYGTRHKLRADWKHGRSTEQSARASGAQQVALPQQGAGVSGPTTADEPARELPVFLDARAQAGKAKRKLSMQCQVVGCNKDLASQKAYFQRYGICEEHLKLSSLLKDGVQQRFCQICNRFHLLADFDGNRRGCRATLSIRKQKKAAKRQRHSKGED